MANRPNLAARELFAMGRAIGKTQAELSRELNISEGTLVKWAKEPYVREKIRELQLERWKEVQGVLLNAQRDALQTLINLLGSRDENVRLKAAKEILAQCQTFPDYAL